MNAKLHQTIAQHAAVPEMTEADRLQPLTILRSGGPVAQRSDPVGEGLAPTATGICANRAFAIVGRNVAKKLQAPGTGFRSYVWGESSL
jgi:hypothetical protein